MKTREVSKLFGLEPTHAFDEGDRYLGRQKVGDRVEDVERVRPRSVWHYDSTEFVKSSNIDDHAEFLAAKLEPAIANIRTLLTDPTCSLVFHIWYVGPGGFGMSSPIVARLAALSHEIGVVCWERDEEEAEQANTGKGVGSEWH